MNFAKHNSIDNKSLAYDSKWFDICFVGSEGFIDSI